MKTMQNKRFGILLLGVIVILFVTYTSEWVRMVNSTSDRTATDFMAFYAGGRVADQYGFPASYEIELQQDVQQEVLGFELAEGQVLLYNHVPSALIRINCRKARSPSSLKSHQQNSRSAAPNTATGQTAFRYRIRIGRPKVMAICGRTVVSASPMAVSVSCFFSRPTHQSTTPA